MPLLDRSWWLRVAAGLALIVVALALANAYSASARTSRSAAASPWLGALFTLLLPMLAVVVALYWGAGAYQAWQRAKARWRALVGDLDAMPPAAFSADPTRAPDLSSAPLVIMWRPNHGIQRAVWLIAMLTLALDGVIVYGARQVMGVKLPIPIDVSSFWLRFAIISAVLLLLSLHVSVLLAAPLALRLPTGVTFTESGVQERTRWGRRRFLRWEDARLFEVAAVQTLDRRYTLYGARRAVHWRDEIPAYDSEAIEQRDHENYVPDHISMEEMAHRLRAALSLVAAHTGLQPRTLSPTLLASAAAGRPRPQSVTPLQVRLRLAGVLGSALATGLTLPLVFLPAALGVAFAHWPPTNSPAVNLISGLALVAASEILLVAIALSLDGVASGKRSRRGAALEDREDDTPDLSGATTYAMPLPGSPLNRRWSIALGLLLLLGGVPGIILLCLLCAEYLAILFFPTRVTALIAQFPHTPGAFVVALLSFCAAVIGLSLTVVALATSRPWRRLVRADAEGLRIEHGGITRTLPWDAVETLTLICVGPTPTIYRLSADSGKVNLSWPAQTGAYLATAPPQGAIAVSPAGMASLIERQPGVRRRIQVLGLPPPTETQAELPGPATPADLPALTDG
jgi:hypothetical protein